MNPYPHVPDEREIEAAVSRLVAATLGKNRIPLGPDGSGVAIRDHFDSFAFLELVLQLEKAFDLHIGDDELDPDYFESIGTLSAFVRSKLNDKR